jgi:ABC-type Na+ efflux pump permease subunit
MVPFIIIFMVLLVGFIAVYVVPSSTTEQPNVIVIQADEGFNNTLWGENFYFLLKNHDTTNDFLYANESTSNFLSFKDEGNFDILIFIPGNFSQMINQSLDGQIFVYYDNSKLSNEDAVNSIAFISALLNQQLVFDEYGILDLQRVSTSIEGTSKGSGALLASSLSIIPLYMILFLVFPPLTLVLISVTMEREQKTLESILLQPIDRKQFIAGKILYGIVIILINSTLTISSILLVILALLFALSADPKNEVNLNLDRLVEAILALDLTFWLFLSYLIVGLIALSLLMVTAGVFFSLLAKDEREANMVISAITIFPLFGTFFLIYVPLGFLPDFVTILISILPLLGYLFSIYQIFLLGELTSIVWLSLLAQFVWTAILIWLAGRLIESEGILQISFKRILRFWKKSY